LSQAAPSFLVFLFSRSCVYRHDFGEKSPPKPHGTHGPIFPVFRPPPGCPRRQVPSHSTSELESLRIFFRARSRWNCISRPTFCALALERPTRLTTESGRFKVCGSQECVEFLCFRVKGLFVFLLLRALIASEVLSGLYTKNPLEGRTSLFAPHLRVLFGAVPFFFAFLFGFRH